MIPNWLKSLTLSLGVLSSTTCACKPSFMSMNATEDETRKIAYELTIYISFCLYSAPFFFAYDLAIFLAWVNLLYGLFFFLGVHSLVGHLLAPEHPHGLHKDPQILLEVLNWSKNSLMRMQVCYLSTNNILMNWLLALWNWEICERDTSMMHSIQLRIFNNNSPNGILYISTACFSCPSVQYILWWQCLDVHQVKNF
jgi:hypothetical protein